MGHPHVFSHQATLAEVARAAGVSIPTVSKVINGRLDVSEATRARVKQLLREHDYVCRPYGRRRQGSAAIGLMFDSFECPYSMEIARGVMNAATADGAEASVTLATATSPGESWVDRVLDSGQDGLILVTSGLREGQRQQLARARTPLVLIDPINVQALVSSASAARTGMVRWRRPYIYWNLDIAELPPFWGCPRPRLEGRLHGLRSVVGDGRLYGFREAMAAAGVPHDPALVRTGPFRYQSGYEHTIDLLSLPKPPTAIFASSDVQALGVIAATRRLGIRVPDQLSVVSFDDTFAARWSAPPLTAVHQPFADMGRAATQILLQLIGGREPAHRCIKLATSLIVRESTASPAAADSVTAAPSRVNANTQPMSFAG